MTAAPLQLHQFCHVDGRKFAAYERKCPQCGTARLVTVDPMTSAAFNAPLVTAAQAHHKPWRKVLYERQAFADNYTDAQFLRGLVQNASVEPYDYWQLVSDSAVVSVECSATVLFALLFVHTYSGSLSPAPLLGLAGAFAVVSVLFVTGDVDDSAAATSAAATAARFFDVDRFARSVPLVLLLYGSVLALAPVMRLLTDSFSDDTIWALVVSLLAVHLLFFSYSLERANDANPVSLNAAIFASVLLGSRLASTAHVFGLISVAIQLFALFPLLRRSLRAYSVRLYLVLVWLLNALVLALATQVSSLLAALFALVLVGITLLSPMWLMSIQRYKNEIHGPWDEARPAGTIADS
jgi:phosphatidylinositol N-acetylglucosaminyltransferase subunit C